LEGIEKAMGNIEVFASEERFVGLSNPIPWNGGEFVMDVMVAIVMGEKIHPTDICPSARSCGEVVSNL
tara:strand:- start:419 stop:622 length:204 start_codon:yes stop_codon:yes gene_type:complete